MAVVYNKWMHVNVVVNQSTKKVSYTITNKADGAEIAKATDVAFVDATTENLKATQIDIFGYIIVTYSFRAVTLN